MKYSEFKKAIEDWGKAYRIDTEILIKGNWTSVCIKNEDSDLELVADISSKDICIFDFSYQSTVDLGDLERKSLFKIVTKFANTWPADRKDKEKKFYLRHRFIGNGGISYLNYRLEDESYTIWAKTSSAGYKSQFTMKEIESIKMIYDTDLEDFELVEVIE